jgi:hypothetical protein
VIIAVAPESAQAMAAPFIKKWLRMVLAGRDVLGFEFGLLIVK